MTKLEFMTAAALNFISCRGQAPSDANIANFEHFYEHKLSKYKEEPEPKPKAKKVKIE